MIYSAIRTNKTVIFWICCLAFVTNGLLSVLPSSSLAILATDTHVALGIAGLVFTVSALGSIIAVFISNILIKKVGTKNIMIAGLGGLILTSVLIPTTGSFNIWLTAQFIQGMSSSLITVGLCMTLTFNFFEQSTTLISSIVLLSSSLASMTVPMSIGLAIPRIGVRDGMLIPVIMSLSICIPFYLANKKVRNMQYQYPVTVN